MKNAAAKKKRIKLYGLKTAVVKNDFNSKRNLQIKDVLGFALGLPNGLRYLRVGGRGQCLRCRKSPKPEKYSKMPQNPTRQVHALLGALLPLRLFTFRAQHPKLKLECQCLKRHVVPNPKRIVQNTKRLTTYLRLILLLAQFLFQHQ